MIYNRRSNYFNSYFSKISILLVRFKQNLSWWKSREFFIANSTLQQKCFRSHITNSTDSLDFDLQLFSIVLWWFGSISKGNLFLSGDCVEKVILQFPPSQQNFHNKIMGKIKTASNKHLIWLLDNQRGDTIEYLRKIQSDLADKYPTAHAFEQQMIKNIQFQIKCFLYFNDRSENTSAQADILISNFIKRYGN